MKKIGLVVKPEKEADKKSQEFEAWLRKKQVEVVRKEYTLPGQTLIAPKGLYCVFVIGGDGTFLSAARWINDRDVPIIGVKFGDVGFLAATTEENLFSVAEEIIEGRFNTVERMRLKVTVFREEKEIACENVLNDIVINKGALARLAHIDTYINDHELTTYKSDGLIVATPTGSTAYSLAAGGPIIHPDVSGIIMTPICPFTLTNRPLIVPDTALIKILLAKKSTDIMLTFDGQEGLEIDDRDMILVERGNNPIRMITIPDQHYFDVLKAKLRWSGSRI